MSSDFNKGIMKFDNADGPLTVALSAIVIFGSVGLLIGWGLETAYLVGQLS
ncbi:MAG: hypothetical protein HC790_03010 [Acaryochloridaceae cyanobacterium CSU_3_4]|nr:hypothetical protein [Acaryochloridaceae cyanobacterium CSU_3_4]